MQTLLKLPEVVALTRKSRAGIYLDIKAGTFPRQIKTGSRSICFVESEVRDWLDARIAERAA